MLCIDEPVQWQLNGVSERDLRPVFPSVPATLAIVITAAWRRDLDHQDSCFASQWLNSNWQKKVPSPRIFSGLLVVGLWNNRSLKDSSKAAANRLNAIVLLNKTSDSV